MGDKYDVAVVGAGFGGLSAALALARAGKRVLIVERQDGPGGVGHVFKRGPYTFDPAIHVTAHGFNIEFLDVYLGGLGIRDKVELVTADDFYSVVLGDERWTVPVGVQPVIDYFKSQFPDDAAGVESYIETCAQVTRESQAPPPEVAIADLDALVAALPNLFKYRNSTAAAALDEYLTDDRAKFLLGAHWPYMGLPPSTQSFMTFSGVWMAFMELGPVYPLGSFQRLADAFVDGILAEGGDAIFDTEVAKIDVTDGVAGGITLEDGTSIAAPIVVANGDAKQTFEGMIGLDKLPPRFVKRLGRMKPSISAFVLFAATTMDLHATGLAHEVFLYHHDDHDKTWEDVEAGRPGGMWLSFPTMLDPSLAPEGEHLVIATSLMPFDIGEPWPGAKQRYADAMIDEVEHVLPGFRESLTFTDSATPEVFERFTLSQQGAIYGWANTPNQTMPKRLDHVSPIEGLYLAGHWTDPGTGSVRCLLSGLRTAATIMGHQDPIAFLGTLHERAATSRK